MRLIRKCSVLGIALAVLMMAGRAEALTITFENLTNNAGNQDVSSQLSAELEAVGANQVAFTFYNIGTVASSITDIYFDDGTLLGIATINDSGAGVAFSQGAAPPNLPGANLASPPFQTTAGFLADSDPPVQPNGVNNTLLGTEWVKITFNLISGQTYADTVNALALGGAPGGLRIGLHVQGLPNGGSDSYINTPPNGDPPNGVPDGGLTIALLGLAIAGMGLMRRMV